ncbi:sigma-E processing peptidase SpoIIGA [Clostridium sp. UBA1056]|uniref:sigma-E processing peptidase SpoIIGA n=1 Tax=unclassified Clostridium TaxID=2614128 RepID=UPI00321742D3
MVVYLDMLLLENFLVNLFLLTITMQTIKKKVPTGRLMLSSIIGTSYVLTIVIPKLQLFATTPFKIVVAVIMILIAIKDKSVIEILKAMGIFVLYSILLAGMAFYLAIKDNPSLSPSAMIYNFSYKNLILSLMITYILVYKLIVYVKERRILTSYVYNTEICIDNVKTIIKAFLDTGNELREPATNLPVIIVEKELFKDLNLKTHDIYNIPYSVVNGYNGKLIGIKPDSVKININGDMREKNLILAFSDKKLSKHSDYNGLLPRGIIE